jgi:hypothetical protein
VVEHELLSKQLDLESKKLDEFDQAAPLRRKILETDAIKRGMDHFFATKDVKGALSFLNPLEEEKDKTVDLKWLGPDKVMAIHADGSKVTFDRNQLMYQNVKYEEQLSQWNDMLKFRTLHAHDKDAKLSPFDEESQKLAAKKNQELIDQSNNLNEKRGEIGDALNEYVKYNQKANLNTGPLAALASKFQVDPELQQLDAKLKKMNLSTMVSTFQNMSRAIDSENDRSMFEKAQTSTITQPSAGVNLLVTAHSATFAQEQENAARRQYIDEHQSEKGYKSPIIGKQIVMYDKTGEPIMVNKNEVKTAQNLGYMKNDDYAKSLLKPKAAPPGNNNMPSANNQNNGFKFLGFEEGQ